MLDYNKIACYQKLTKNVLRSIDGGITEWVKIFYIMEHKIK